MYIDVEGHFFAVLNNFECLVPWYVTEQAYTQFLCKVLFAILWLIYDSPSQK